MPIINIELRSKADLTGFQQISAAAGQGAVSVAGFGAKLGLGIAGAQTVFALVKNEIRHIIADIDKIPGLPRETLDSVNRGKQVFSEFRGSLDRTIAGAIGGFADFAESVVYTVGALVDGSDAAATAWANNRRGAETAAEAAKRAADDADQLKTALDEVAAASKRGEERFKAFRAAVENTEKNNTERSQVGESLGARIARLQVEVGDRARAAAALKGNDAAYAIALDRETSSRLELERAEYELQLQAAALGQKQGEAEFKKLSATQQIATLQRELTLNKQWEAELDLNNPKQLEQYIFFEERRLAIEQQLAEIVKAAAEARQKAQADTVAALESQAKRLQAERAIAQTKGDKVEVNRLLTEEREILTTIAAKYREIADTAATPAEAEAARARAAGLESTLPTAPKSKFQTTSETFADRNSPENSYQGTFEALKGGWMEFVNTMETTSNSIANTLRTSLGTAVDGISDGIYGMITRTKTWGQVGLQVGAQILQSLIKMGVQIMVNSALGVGAQKTQQVTAATTGPSIAASYAPASAAVNTATYGSSAVVGAAAAAAAIGLIIGLLAKGFAEGGFTTQGPEAKPVGIVHAGEWVAPQWMLSHPLYGSVISGLEGARLGLPGYLAGGLTRPAYSPVLPSSASSPSSGSSALPPMYFHADAREAQRRAWANGDMDAVFVDVFKRTQHRHG